MNDKISFNINNGDKQIWEQSEHDNSVKLYTLVNDWTEENTISIPAGDMVMLANLYRTIKDNNITNPYINPNGLMKPATGEDLSKAVERQIPKKSIDDFSTHAIYDNDGNYLEQLDTTTFKCPICNHILASGEISKSDCVEIHYCENCGQALDWSDAI